MSSTLSEGVRVPDIGSTSWGADVNYNWGLLNTALANISGNVKTDAENTWTAPQTFTETISGSIDGVATRAVGDEDGNNIKSTYGKLAGANIWTNAQDYKSSIRFTNDSYASGTPSANIFYTTIRWGGYVNNTWTESFTINNAIRTNGYNDISFRTHSQTTNTLTGFLLETNADASDISFRPLANGTYNLGNSSYKWKTLNGINPGALSLPANSYVAIDTTNFNKSGGLNTYTPPSNGWVGIQAASVSYNASYYVFIGRFTDGTTANPSYWSQGQVSPLMANFDGYIGQVFIPVIGGKLYHIRINGDFSTGGSIKAYFFPCLGNV